MESPGASSHERDLAAERHRCERWFVRRGLPHLIHDYSASSDVLTRAAPFLAFVVFVEFFFVFGDRWTGWAQAVVFVVGLAVMAGVVALVNLLRGRRLWQLPDRFGVTEVLAYLVLGAVFAGLGSSDSIIVDAAFAAGLNAVLLVGAYVVTSWGLLPMMRWSVGQLWRQVGQVMTLLAKSLPILLVFSAFIFLNAEMWQVANDFTLPFFGMVALLLVAVGALFVIISVRRLAVDMARFSSWSDVRAHCADTPIASLAPADDAPAPDSPPLSRRARFNVSLLLFVAQSIQIRAGGGDRHVLLRALRRVHRARKHPAAVDHAEPAHLGRLVGGEPPALERGAALQPPTRVGGSLHRSVLRAAVRRVGRARLQLPLSPKT